ncbi:hypothetical protein ACP70R_047791 [Stipagrostis hirtigluma subsp. patula]
MRVLSVTGFFSAAKRPAATTADDDGELVYGLTPASHLLVGSSSLTPFLTLMLDGVFVSPFFGLGAWLQRSPAPDRSLFEVTHGHALREMGDGDPAFGELLHEGLVADTSFIMDVVVKECGHVFQGVSSLVDVAGGLGTAAQTIAKAFPHVKCSVLDLRHVVANAPVGTGVDYIAGDMFESIPSANAVFLKWILHDWGDAECVKLLKNCKKAIPSKEEGGKVIILDMVVGTGLSNPQHKEMQVLFDLFMMFMNGIERDEHQWKKIILEAGYSGYKIIPIAGWILHDWGDAECVKLLKNCQKAIPSREGGGKVIILDMVVGAGLSNPKHKEMQVLFNLFMMFMNGIERDEQQWRRLFRKLDILVITLY